MKLLTKILPLSLLFAATGPFVSAALMQLGENTSLHLLVDADYVYTDNLFLQTNPSADSYMEFAPGLELKLSRDAAITMGVRYQQRYTFFDTYSELDGSYADLSADISYNSGRVLASGYYSFQELASNTVDANQDGVLIERDQYTAGGRLKYELTELTAVQVGADYNEIDYKSPGYTDQDDMSYPVTFFYQIRPKVDLTAGFRLRDVNTSGLYDYTDTYYFVGAVGEFFSPVIFADIQVGYQQRDFDNQGYDTSAGTYNIQFIYTGNVKTTVYLGFSQDYRTSADQGDSYTWTSGTLGARYSLTEAFGLNASILYGETDYEQIPRAEDITIIEVGASFSPNDSLILRATYVSQVVDGKTVFSSDYTTGTFRVSASVRY
jgi:hypothetical protein